MSLGYFKGHNQGRGLPSGFMTCTFEFAAPHTEEYARVVSPRQVTDSLADHVRACRFY